MSKTLIFLENQKKKNVPVILTNIHIKLLLLTYF